MAATSSHRRAPAHLWIVGLLALVWNAFGCFDYLMTQTGDTAYLAKFPPEQLAYFNSLPTWITALWAVGVWGGLAGAILLLLRSRFAIHAFAASLVGIVVSFAYEMALTTRPESMKQLPLALMPWVIFLVAAFLLWYARQMDRTGVLR
jgi:hypothetical protein